MNLIEQLAIQAMYNAQAGFAGAEKPNVAEKPRSVLSPLDHDGDGRKGGSLPDAIAPRRRGRKPKGE